MTTVRVTQNLLVGRSIGSLQTSLARLATLQEQASTGRRINRSSDSPTDASQAMQLRTALSAVEQHTRNASDATSRLGLADHTLSTVTDLLQHAHDLAVQGANSGATSPTAQAALATELDQVRASMLDQANTGFLGRPLFGGVTAGTLAYDNSGNYVGTAGQVTRRVGENTRIRVDVDGVAVFGDGATSVFAELDALSTALRTGDDAGISAGMGALTTRLNSVLTVQATVGAAYKRVDQAQSALVDGKLNLTTELSNVESIDLPETMVNLNMQEVAYKTALGATARVIQPSLLDFLR